MCIQICVTNVLTSRAILIEQLYIPFFQNEMVSHLPTNRGFCQRGQLTTDYWWYLSSQITIKKNSISCVPCSQIFKKILTVNPEFLTISIFEIKFRPFSMNKNFFKENKIIFRHLLVPFNEQKLEDIFRV